MADRCEWRVEQGPGALDIKVASEKGLCVWVYMEAGKLKLDPQENKMPGAEHSCIAILTLGENGVLAVSVANPDGVIGRKHIASFSLPQNKSTDQFPENY